MDQRPRHDEPEQTESGGQTVSRRAFFNRARLGLIAVAGVTVFGIASTTSGATAAEDDEDEKKKEKSKPRDKDQEAKEKEKEKEAKQKKSEENSSNTKKKKKNTNGDDSKKKKEKTPASPYAKYVEKGKDRYACTDFPNQFDSQQVLRLAPKDPNNLDGNRNGIACDGQDAFMDGVPAGLMGSPFDLNPVPRP